MKHSVSRRWALAALKRVCGQSYREPRRPQRALEWPPAGTPRCRRADAALPPGHACSPAGAASPRLWAWWRHSWCPEPCRHTELVRSRCRHAELVRSRCRHTELVRSRCRHTELIWDTATESISSLQEKLIKLDHGCPSSDTNSWEWKREQLTSVWTPDASETRAGPDSEPDTESRSERNLQHTHTQRERVKTSTTHCLW